MATIKKGAKIPTVADLLNLAAKTCITLLRNHYLILLPDGRLLFSFKKRSLGRKQSDGHEFVYEEPYKLDKYEDSIRRRQDLKSVLLLDNEYSELQMVSGADYVNTLYSVPYICPGSGWLVIGACGYQGQPQESIIYDLAGKRISENNWAGSKRIASMEQAKEDIGQSKIVNENNSYNFKTLKELFVGSEFMVKVKK